MGEFELAGGIIMVTIIPTTSIDGRCQARIQNR
jgi:hypothetical protein